MCVCVAGRMISPAITFAVCELGSMRCVLIIKTQLQRPPSCVALHIVLCHAFRSASTACCGSSRRWLASLQGINSSYLFCFPLSCLLFFKLFLFSRHVLLMLWLGWQWWSLFCPLQDLSVISTSSVLQRSILSVRRCVRLCLFVLHLYAWRLAKRLWRNAVPSSLQFVDVIYECTRVNRPQSPPFTCLPICHVSHISFIVISLNTASMKE